jgi:hypothetical protein
VSRVTNSGSKLFKMLLMEKSLSKGMVVFSYPLATKMNFLQNQSLRRLKILKISQIMMAREYQRFRENQSR